MTTKITASSAPDYDGAIDYALQRLTNELPETLAYHRAWHTEFDVLPAAQRLACLSGLALSEQRLLEVGAAFHDIGFIFSPVDHEAVGVELIKEVLPRFGFTETDIKRVAGLILATRLPQSPTNHLEELLVDADLDSLGRSDYLETSSALWREFAAFDKIQTWECWLYFQLNFLRSHQYFTEHAKSLRDAGKKENIAMLEQLIRDEAGDAGDLAPQCPFPIHK